MKNWTDFLPQKSHLLAKKGKILTALLFDVMEAENKFKSRSVAFANYDNELQERALLNNNLEQINEAKLKCEAWNNTPTKKLINPNKKK